MDPMILSQGMYGGFGGQGMGMNSMNVGMGFNAGQSAFGGFNGQPAAWNAGQDKFNQNAYGATGMGGDFGAAAGYGGYNMPQHQGNFNQMHHHQYQNNDFQSGYNGPGFYNRGRGRGRGYQNASRGRGGFHQVTPSNQANYEPFHHQIPQQLAQQDSSLRPPSSEAQNGQEQPKQAADVSHLASDAKTNMGHAEDEQLAKELEPGDADDAADDNGTVPPINPSNGEDDASTPIEPLKAIMKENEELESDKNLLLEKENKPAPIETFVSSDTKEPEVSQVSDSMMAPSVMMPPPAPAIPLGPAALYSADHLQDFGLRGRGGGRGFYKGSSDYRGGLRGRSASINPNTAVVPSSSVPTVPAADIALTVPIEPKGLGVEGAPKAPKALREGLPNTGMRGGRGFSIIGRASSATQGRPNGRARSRRCVDMLKAFHQPVSLLTAIVALHLLAPDLRFIITTVLTAIALKAARKIAIMRKDVSATVVMLVTMKSSTMVNPRTLKTRIQEKDQLNLLLGDPHIEVIETMRKRKKQAGAATVLTVHNGNEVEIGMESHVASGGAQDPLAAT